jgi:hypothetical protein
MELETDKLFFLNATPWKSVKNSKLKIEEKTRNIELAAVYCCLNQRGEKRQTVYGTLSAFYL